MRISQDKSSWRAGGILKRDFKHSGSDVIKYPKKSKNKYRWCYGKVGKEHTIERSIHGLDPDDFYWFKFNRISAKCINCKREFYGMRITHDKQYKLHIIPERIMSHYEIEVRYGTL